MCDLCEYEYTLESIEDLLNDDRYEFANETLSGIYEWVKGKKHVTENQRNAVDNIIAAVECGPKIDDFDFPSD